MNTEHCFKRSVLWAWKDAERYGCDTYYDYHLDLKENFKDNNWIGQET